MATPEPSQIAASMAFQHPTPAEVMNAEDLKLERVLDREKARAEAAYANGHHERARMHWRNYAELKATRRPVVVKALERERNLR